MKKGILVLIALVIIPILINLITGVIGDKNWKFYALISYLFLLLIIYFLADFYIKHKRQSSELDPTGLDLVMGDLARKSEIQPIDGMGNLTNLEINDFVDFQFVAQSRAIFHNKRRDAGQIKSTISNALNSVVVILGNSGVGKTTFSRWLISSIAIDSIRRRSQCLPFLLRLRDYATSQNPHSDIIDLLSITTNLNPSKWKLVFILDGINEIGEDQLNEIVRILNKYVYQRGFNFSLVLTGRPLSLTDKLLEILPSESKKYFLKIVEWEPSQLSRYLERNHISRGELLNYSKELQNLLRTPFFAFLFCVQKAKREGGNISSLKELIEGFLSIWLNPKESDSEYYQKLTRLLGNSKTNLDSPTKRKILVKLAYQLTLNEKLVFHREATAKMVNMRNISSDVYGNVLLELVNFGLLIPASEENTDILQFRHQIFQEYLAAAYLISTKKRYPISVQDNIFWKDIPIFHFVQLNSNEQKNKLADEFSSRKDWLTIVRLSTCESTIQESLASKAVSKVIESFGEFDKYAFASEVIELSKGKGENKLMEIISGLDSTIVAPEELPDQQQFTEEQLKEMELKWRYVGRSIQVLSAIGSERLFDLVISKMLVVGSSHLLYHLLEYAISPKIHIRWDKKLRMILTLLKLRQSEDPLVKLYSAYLLNQLAGFNFNKIQAVEKKWRVLYQHIEEHHSFSDDKYRNTFWIRNHGLEALSSLHRKNLHEDFLELINKMLKKEEEFQYDPEKPFYFAVHTSIAKSLSNLFVTFEAGHIECLILSLLKSRRFNENDSALKILSRNIKLYHSKYSKLNLNALLLELPSTLKSYSMLKSLISEIEMDIS